MSVDKFGRHSSGQIYTEPGVSVRYVNNKFIRRDGGDLNLSNNKIVKLSEPTEVQDAATKQYLDSRKPLITIWAQENCPLNAGEYEWSFGSGDLYCRTLAKGSK